MDNITIEKLLEVVRDYNEEAVEDVRRAYEYASSKLKKDNEIMLESIKQNGFVIGIVDKQLITEKLVLTNTTAIKLFGGYFSV